MYGYAQARYINYNVKVARARKHQHCDNTGSDLILKTTVYEKQASTVTEIYSNF